MDEAEIKILKSYQYRFAHLISFDLHSKLYVLPPPPATVVQS